MPLTFITGPVRSGKTRFAVRLARESERPVTFVATARIDPSDAEWTARLARHGAERPEAWRTVETGCTGSPALEDVLRAATSGETIVVDSLGTWLAARMSVRLESAGEGAALDVAVLEREAEVLAEAFVACTAHAFVVGDEVGWSLVPTYPSGRAFRDVLGRLQQRLAVAADAAYLVVSGLAVDLRTLARPVEG